MLSYLRQDTAMTLAEGLEDYQRANPELLEAFAPASSGEQMLRAHDIAHVVFGCTTELRGEVLVHAWTVFGTTQTLHQAHEATGEAEHRHVFGSLGWAAIPEIIKALPLVVRVAVRSQRMRRKWPYHDFEAYFDHPLGDLRRQFGICVLT